MKNWRFGTKVVLSIEILADRICILGSQNSRYAKLESNIIGNYTWYKNLGKSQKKAREYGKNEANERKKNSCTLVTLRCLKLFSLDKIQISNQGKKNNKAEP